MTDSCKLLTCIKVSLYGNREWEIANDCRDNPKFKKSGGFRKEAQNLQTHWNNML